MEKPKLTKSGQKMLDVIDEMKKTSVWILVNGEPKKVFLWDLCQNLKEKIQYYNIVNRPTKDHPDINFTQKIVHDFGFRFKDETEIRHVKASHFNYFSAFQVVERKERI